MFRAKEQPGSNPLARRVLLLQAAVLCLLVLPFVGPVFRDNDQANILSGSWQIARHQATFFHATFYNFDKQWGTFLTLRGLFSVSGQVDPVLVGNIAVTALASLAWISLGIRTGRTRNAPLLLLLPVLLSPALILYMPFLGTGWFSLAFLLLAFFFLGSAQSQTSRAGGFVLLAFSAACRGDVVLAAPALMMSLLQRGRFRSLLQRPVLWLAASGAVLPVFLGKWLAGATIPDSNPLSFDPKAYLGFLLFGLTPAILILLCGSTILHLYLAYRKRRFRFFYFCLAIAPLVPFVFYSLQLYTLRYLFLTIASLLFVISSRRFVWLLRSYERGHRRIYHWAAISIAALTLAPWVIGLNVPALSHPRLTLSNPTRFPTGDGRFPMGGYLGFERQILFEDHLTIDHNQQIWLAAKGARYQACPDGTVPFLESPMSNFLEFAIRLKGQEPRYLDDLTQSPCGAAYVDVRSIIRRYRPTEHDGPIFDHQITFASEANNGQLIARIGSGSAQTPEAKVLNDLQKVLHGRNSEVFLAQGTWRIPVEPGLQYAVFSEQPCQIAIAGDEPPMQLKTFGFVRGAWPGNSKEPEVATVTCRAPISGWARTVLPEYMGGGSHY